MLFRLFLLFALLPVIELALLVQIGSRIGVTPTVALVLATGAAGAFLARAQGPARPAAASRRPWGPAPSPATRSSTGP